MSEETEKKEVQLTFEQVLAKKVSSLRWVHLPFEQVTDICAKAGDYHSSVSAVATVQKEQKKREKELIKEVKKEEAKERRRVKKDEKLATLEQKIEKKSHKKIEIDSEDDKDSEADKKDADSDDDLPVEKTHKLNAKNIRTKAEPFLNKNALNIDAQITELKQKVDKKNSKQKNKIAQLEEQLAQMKISQCDEYNKEQKNKKLIQDTVEQAVQTKLYDGQISSIINRRIV